MLAVEFTDNLNGWAGGEGLYRTGDGGLHWEAQQTGMKGDVQAIQFIDAQIGWLATDWGELWYTGNGGNRWRSLDSTTGFALRGLHFVNAQWGWIVGDGGTILRYTADHLPVAAEVYLPVVNK